MKKNIIVSISGLFLFGASVLSCTKELTNSGLTPPSPLSSYNISAYANGDFITFNTCSYSVSGNTLSIQSEWMTNASENFYLDFNSITINKGYIGTYTLNSQAQAVYQAINPGGISGYVFTYTTDPTHTGILSITAYDSINKTISGTFNFTGTGGKGSDAPLDASYPSTMSITNGILTKVPL